jgi:hypothetical protein
LKFLVIAALFALLLLLLYSRIYPYLQFVKKILGVAKTMGPSNNPDDTASRAAGKTDGQLVRCVGCGTWIPVERAIGNKAGMSFYCSRDCIEKKSNSNERKIAG